MFKRTLGRRDAVRDYTYIIDKARASCIFAHAVRLYVININQTEFNRLNSAGLYRADETIHLIIFYAEETAEFEI